MRCKSTFKFFQPEPKFFNFQGPPQASISQNRFLVRINFVMALILGRGEVEPKKKVDSSFKNLLLMGHIDSIPYLVPIQFQESMFPPITSPKILAQNLHESREPKTNT